MIRINLLPEALRPRSAATWGRPEPRKIGYALLGGCFVFSAGLLGWNSLLAGREARLKAAARALRPQETRWQELNETLGSLRDRDLAFAELKSPQKRWAPRLNLLSDALVPGLWFTSLEAGGGRVSLRGTALADGSGGKRAAVGAFMKRLKAQPEFSRWFSAVDLVSVVHRQMAGREVVDFELHLTTKE